MSVDTSRQTATTIEQQGRTPAVEAIGVHKIFDTGAVRVHALRGIDFRVYPGEMVAVMGASGSGKTTLLNCLSGLDTVTEGVVRINGTDLADLADDERTDYRAKNMGFIFQTFNLLPVLTAVENVELPLVVSGTRPSVAREKAMAMLEQVGLADWANHKPAELSGGQRQRVTVARALVNEPAIVWADEPTGALDSENASEIMNLMRDLNRRNGQTFLIVTHDPRVAAVCERLVRMRDGEIISDEPAREAFAGSEFAESYNH
ncbi:MAG TPA: ABC transporter ATP-binding protein [Thermomicrobiales bacterium]|nr:ABC transporter ATP-binding protein [Thermomicrobiales bacterium]